jgi:hypothetical protein
MDYKRQGLMQKEVQEAPVYFGKGESLGHRHL